MKNYMKSYVNDMLYEKNYQYKMLHFLCAEGVFKSPIKLVVDVKECLVNVRL